MKIFLLTCLLFSPFWANSQIISTVAGTGAAGYNGDGISASSAKLYQPSELNFDTYGNLYVNDAYNKRIRKISSSGTIYTYAGTGVSGYNGDNGLADTSKVSDGVGKVAVVKGNTLLVADGNNQRIRKIDFYSHIINTIAGNGVAGFSGDGASATAAQLNYPGHIAIDKIGNLYIADVLNKRIRKVDTFGIISTYAGAGIAGFGGDGGLADTARFSSSILGLACDASGNLYIADRLNGRVRRIDAVTKIISSIAGNGTGSYSGASGVPATSEGICPGGLAFDTSNNLFIADFLNMRILKVTPTGNIYSVSGTGVAGFSGDGGLADTARLNYPYDVAFDPCGNLYVADANNERIRRITFNPTCNILRLETANPHVLSQVRIYPNPAINELIITSDEKKICNLALFNIIGQIVFEQSCATASIKLDISNFPPGVYLIAITDDEQQKIVKKLVKQ
jgi:sugar lactone lactonase YvrE